MTQAAGRWSPGVWALGLAPVGALAILVAHRTHPVVPVALSAALAAVVLAYLRPLAAVLLAVALVPLELFAIPLGSVALSPSELMFVLTGIVWAGRRMFAGEAPWTRTSLGRPLLLLWAASLPGLVVAEDPAAVLRFVVIWGALLLVFQLIVTEARTEHLRTMLFVLAVVGAVIGAVAALGVTGQELSALGDRATGRAVGAFGDPNILATFLAMALPGALLVALAGRWERRPVAVIAAALIFAGLALSLSRGGLFAAAGAVLVMLGWQPMRRIAVLCAVVLVGVSIANANPLGDVQQVQTVLQRVESVRFQGSAQFDQRELIYTETPRMIADHWLTGVGANNYGYVAPQYGIVEPFGGDTFEHAHNIALTFAAEQGLPGLLAFGWLLFAVARLVPSACGRAAGRARGVGFAVVAALVALGLQGVVDFTLRSNMIAALAFLLLGMLAVVAREARAGGRGSTPPAPA